MSNSDAPLDVGRLRLLREVALRGSIAAAARSFGLTPSAVSQQLAVLEREVGTSVVDRSTRGVALTGAGHALAARAGEVLDILAAARADLDRLDGAMSGPVAIASVASAAATFVSAAATGLARAHPGITLSVTAAEPDDALEFLLAGDVDLAVVDEYDYVPLALPEHVAARELCSEPLVLVRPAADRGRRVPALAQLSEAAWVMPPEQAACGQAVRSACRAAGFEPHVRWQTDDMLLLARAVADGHGLAILPRLSVPATGSDGAAIAAELTVTPLRSPPLRRRLTLVGRSTTMARPVMSTVSDALAEAAKTAVARL